jgi:hypothetical protein
MEPGATLQSAASAAVFAFEQEIALSATMSALNKPGTDGKRVCKFIK